MNKKFAETLPLDFNNVLIYPSLSNIDSRKDVELNTNFDFVHKQKNWCPIPIMSANMDTITGINMAYELVKHNMIAVLHKYVSIDEIKKLFDKIDLFNEKMKKINFKKPTENDIKFLIEEGLLPTLIEKDSLVDKEKKMILEKEYKASVNKKLEDLSKSLVYIDYRNVFVSRGTSKEDKVKLEERIKFEPRILSICIDVANGYRNGVFEYIEELRNGLCENKILMVGNIATPDALIKYDSIGVDIAKCGIGQGSACLTRVKTGVGVPQLGMILDLYSEREKHKLNIKICSDGGCTIPADIAKAFVGGADFVMIGGMLSGHKECPGDIIEMDGKKFVRFSGMAASESQWNGVPEYGTDEGKTVFRPYKGKVKNTINDIFGGLRSTCTYTNSKSLKDLINAKFVKSNIQENRIFS